MSENKYPYYAGDEDLGDVYIFFEYCGNVYRRKIPKKGIARYLYENDTIGSLEYMYIQEIKQTRQYNAIAKEDATRKKRDSYYVKRENSKAKNKEPLYDDMD